MRLIIAFLLITGSAFAQFQAFDETPTIGPSTPTGKSFNENIIFEARPIVKFQIHDHLWDRILNGDKDSSWISRTFLVFDPQLRMLTSNSVPVRMPSYRIFLQTSATHLFGGPSHPWSIGSLILDHGHYSNGQDGCTFGSTADNDSTCKDIYKTLDTKVDLDAALNRRSGEYSTDFLRVKTKLMWIRKLYDTQVSDAWEFTGGYTHLVNWWFGFGVGGYKEADTHYYPMNQYYLEIARHHYFLNPKNSFLHDGQQLRGGIELFVKPSDNSQVTPFNVAAFATFYLQNTLGFFVKAEYGQDAYNIRLVDKVTRGMVGLVWSPVSYEPTTIEFPRKGF